MKNHQINFFITPEESQIFFRYLKNAGWEIVKNFSNSPQFPLMSAFDKGLYMVYKDAKAIEAPYIAEQGVYVVDIAKTAAIEFWMPTEDATDGGKIRRGRLFVVTENQTDSFLLEAKEVFRWFKKNFPNQNPEEKNFIVSAGVSSKKLALVKI